MKEKKKKHTYAAAAISASHAGRLPVIITNGSCNCLLALAVSLKLMNSDGDKIGDRWEDSWKNKY